MRTDIHQHIWTPPLVEALERRRRLPFVRCDGELCVVHAAGEAPSAVDLAGERPAWRRELLGRDGVDCAVVAMSSRLGIEALARREAAELIDAHLEGVEALPAAFRAWGPLALDGIVATDVDALLERGCIGVSLSAGALGSAHAVESLHPVLRRIEALDAPLFVHPGPGLGERPAETSLTDPVWWQAMTRYVAQMHRAWLTLGVLARRTYPRLRVVFAMLAGGAPLLDERLRARGGPSSTDCAGELTFYDTSSHGAMTIEAMARRVGHRQLLYGSDRPVVEPVWSGVERHLAGNAARFIGIQSVAA